MSEVRNDFNELVIARKRTCNCVIVGTELFKTFSIRLSNVRIVKLYKIENMYTLINREINLCRESFLLVHICKREKEYDLSQFFHLPSVDVMKMEGMHVSHHGSGCYSN